MLILMIILASKNTKFIFISVAKSFIQLPHIKIKGLKKKTDLSTNRNIGLHTPHDMY